jgi:putative Mg2+ transporter-C (MgtC) family protein
MMSDDISFIAGLLNFDPFTWQGIATSLLCGTIVGAERQMRGKPVGIRTATLITLGTYAFIVGALSISTEMTDPSRIIGQVITGVGFLGAGVMLTRRGVVFGVTSAATIWCMASIGVCVAIGELATAIKLAVVVVSVLAGVDFLEDYMLKISNGVNSRFKRWRNPEE